MNSFIECEENSIFSRVCERAIFIGIRESEGTLKSARSHLNELESLVRALGIQKACSLLVRLKSIHPRWLLGKGKVEEVRQAIVDLGADLVVFDSDLSPGQQRNLEQNWHTAVIDRREVILDIFADRATTREAVLQVALARMKYSLPRLTRAWTHLSRQRGGAKGNRGKGETQLETDRRIVLNKIAHLKRDLARVRSQRDVRRKKRLDRPVPSVSLVGYTNAGKSSLMNAISDSGILVQDKLFVTLDPTTRRVKHPGGREFLMTDTVGFIRKLPHDLVDAFHSTLEEAILADVILHVADARNPDLDEHVMVTETVLQELGAKNKPRILVLNKCDSLNENEREVLFFRYPHAVLVSAHSGEGLERLMQTLGRQLDSSRFLVTLRLPPDRWDLRARLHREASILSEEYDEKGLTLSVRLSREEQGRLSDFVIAPS